VTDIRVDIVSLICDVEDLSQYPNLKRSNGQPLTEGEVWLVGTATLTEMQAVQRYSAAASDYYQGVVADAERMCELLDKYATDLDDDDTPIKVIRARMPAAVQAELDEIWDRAAPDGYLHLNGGAP
jgi:hypothetical protein